MNNPPTRCGGGHSNQCRKTAVRASTPHLACKTASRRLHLAVLNRSRAPHHLCLAAVSGRILVIKPCSMTLNIDIEGEMTNSSSECCCCRAAGAMTALLPRKQPSSGKHLSQCLCAPLLIGAHQVLR